MMPIISATQRFFYRTADTQYLLPGMPARQHQPKSERNWDDEWDDGEESEEPEWEPWMDNWSHPDDWRHEEWMHVSPHKLEPGTVLTPGGGKSPYTKNLAPGHRTNVWIDNPAKMQSWTNEMREHSPDATFHYYDVEPEEMPEPHPWGHELGWSTPSARIVRQRHGFDPNNYEGY